MQKINKQITMAKNFYRGVLYTVHKRMSYNFEEDTQREITEYVCNDVDLLNDYDVNQFVVYNEAEMHNRIDYYFDEYEDYLQKKAIKDKHAENTLKQQGWELD